MLEILECAIEDLKVLNNVIQNNYKYKESIQNLPIYLFEIRGKYDKIIKDFKEGLAEDYRRKNSIGRNTNISLDLPKLKNDTNFIMGRLETFVVSKGKDYNYDYQKGNIVIHNNNNNLNHNNNETSVDVSMNASYENVVSVIQNITSLPESEIQNLLGHIKEIEDLKKNTQLRKQQKWEGISKAATYVLDKGLDIGIACLPYIVEAAKQIT